MTYIYKLFAIMKLSFDLVGIYLNMNAGVAPIISLWLILNDIENIDQFISLFGVVLLIVFSIFFYLGINTLNKLYKVDFDENYISFKHMITRRKIKVTYNEIRRIKQNYFYTSIIIDFKNIDNTIKLKKASYKNFEDLVAIFKSKCKTYRSEKYFF